MRRPKHKLNLARTTIRSLSLDELRRSGGGYVIKQSGFCTQTLESCNNVCAGYPIDTSVLSEIKTNCGFTIGC